MISEDKRLQKNTVTSSLWRYSTELVGEDNVEKLFVPLDNRRDIRNSQVSNIRRLLEKGAHFDSPVVVNLKNDKYRIIDGNHRLEAIKNYLKKYPGRKIELRLCIYDNLDDAEEKEVFTRWNLGAKQSVNDFLQLHWDDLKMPAWWNKNAHQVCGLAHKGRKNVIGLSMMMVPYISRDSSTLAWSPNGAEFVSIIKSLTTVDYNRVKQFMQGYTATFGYPDPTNKTALMWQQLQFWSMAAVYWRNQHRVQESEMWKRLYKASRNPSFISPPSGMTNGGRDNVKYLYDVIIISANAGVHKGDKIFPMYSEQHQPSNSKGQAE